jgi:hypothetical protein
MTYTEEDILDLYTDLCTIGAAETLEERMHKMLRELPENTSLRYASILLTSEEVPHTFYTRLDKCTLLNKIQSTSWILFEGKAVFYEGPYYSSYVSHSWTVERIGLQFQSDPTFQFISEEQTSNLNNLPLSCTQTKTS